MTFMNEKAKKSLFFILKISFAVLILLYLKSKVNFSTEDFRSLDPFYLLLAAFCMLAQLLLSVVRWYALLRVLKVQMPFKQIFFLGMQGAFFTLFIPAGAVGGDIVKAGILAKRAGDGEKVNGVLSILADRLCGLAGLLLLTLFSGLLSWKQIDAFPKEFKAAVCLVLLACGAGLIAMGALLLHDYFFRFPLLKKMLDFADARSKGFFTNVINVTVLYRKNWKTLFLWFFLSAALMFPLLAGTLAALAKAADADQGVRDPLKSCLLASTLSQTAGVLPVTPGGIGTRDLVSASVMKECGFSAESATMTALLYTAIYLLLSMSCAIFFIFDPGARKRIQQNGDTP